MRTVLLSCVSALLLAGCTDQSPRLPEDAPVRTLTIRWQRLVDASDNTCPRCASTEQEVLKAFDHLQRSLGPAGIQVKLETQRLDEATFLQAPLESNRIWINEKAIEEWLDAQSASSPCCDACGDSPCRTLSVGNQTYEAIPAGLIVRAGFIAAGDLLRDYLVSPASGDSLPTWGF